MEASSDCYEFLFWSILVDNSGMVARFLINNIYLDHRLGGSTRGGEGGIAPIFWKNPLKWNAQGGIFTIECTNGFSEVSSKFLQNPL